MDCDLSNPILPKTCPLVKRETAISGEGGALPDMRHVPATGLQPEGRRMSAVQSLLPLPRPSRARVRSLRRPFTPPRTAGPYRLPRDAWDQLVSALAPARNRDAALALAVFLGRFWSTLNGSVRARATALGRRGLGWV